MKNKSASWQPLAHLNYLISGVTGQESPGLSPWPQEEELREGEGPVAVLGEVGHVLAVGAVLVRNLQHGHLAQALFAERN